MVECRWIEMLGQSSMRALDNYISPIGIKGAKIKKVPNHAQFDVAEDGI